MHHQKDVVGLRVGHSTREHYFDDNATNTPTMQCQICLLHHPSPPLKSHCCLTNTAARPPPPSHPKNATVQALRSCHPENAAGRPPLPQPLSLPTATACYCHTACHCHCCTAGATPTMLRRATVRNPQTPGESPARAHNCPAGRGGIEMFGRFFFSIYSIFNDCNLLVYVKLIIKSFVNKIHCELSHFCDFVYFSTYFCVFHRILPVPTSQYTFILLLLPNIMFT
jgi:hypothetical protein